MPVDAECTKATGDAAKLLVDLGHYVEEDSPRFDVEAFCLAVQVVRYLIQLDLKALES